MAAKLQSVKRDIFVRQCLECGYDGELLRDGHAPRCPNCGCDLRQRPARSYAEMEGLAGPAGPSPMATRYAATVQRWLVFLLVVLVGLILTMHLVDAAIP
jgi:hypothetical protein